MGHFDYKKAVQGTYLDRRNPPYLLRHPATGLVRTSGEASPPSYSPTSFGNRYDIERFNAPKDRLEEGSIMEDWIPRQPTGLHLMLRKIYLRDAIAGTVVDIYSTLPWGKIYELIGINDPKVLQMYQDMMEAIHIWQELPLIAREYLVIGRCINSLSFNERLGHWNYLTPIDPDQARIEPVPVSGHKPLIDVLSSPGWRRFARSTDPRVVEIKEKLSPNLIQVLQNQSGYIPLDPYNTLFVARRVDQYDHIGTSMFSRILPAWAYEMALWNASLTGVRRRNRSILLVQAGIEDSWEPTEEDIASISSLFMQADEDPTGAIVAVRNGVEVSEVRDPTAIWGISQEFEFLSTLKMRALGVSEAYLSGETNVSNMETASSSLGKSVAAFRDFLLNEIFMKQLFPTFARLHNIQKRTKAELDHNIRINKSTKNAITARDALDIPLDALVIPKIATENTLRPEQDPAYLEILTTLKGEGVPIPLRIWASAAGYDLDKAIAMMEQDVLLRKRLQQIMGGQLDEGGGDMMGGEEMGADQTMPEGEGGSEEAPMSPGGSAEDLFKEEEKASQDSPSNSLPPKWGVQSRTNTLPYQTGKVLGTQRKLTEAEFKHAIEYFKKSPMVNVLSKIAPNILVDLALPPSKALVPYSEK